MLGLARHIPPLVFEHRLTELTYFVTDACNMKCRHCFVHEALNRRSPELSVDEIRQMARHIPAMQRVHLGGGEPFTRHDIADLAVAASNDWNAGVVCIPTNGWFTDRILDGMQRFGEQAKGNLRLHFSINSPDPDAMDNFTQLKGSFKRWRRSIDEALVLAQRFPQITVVALATYNEFNQHEFKALIDFLHRDVKVQDFSFQLVRTHGDYAPKLDIQHFRDMNDYYFRTYNRQNAVLATFREATRERSADYFEAPAYQRRCTSGKIRVVMSPAGDVYPCEKLGYPNLRTMDSWFMGNVRDFGYDVNALIRSPLADAIYQRIVGDHCHCDHNIDQSMSLLSTGKFCGAVLKQASARLLGRQTPTSGSH
jgi:molybdenum cofactor biosynthesis enzyme MoaA